MEHFLALELGLDAGLARDYGLAFLAFRLLLGSRIFLSQELLGLNTHLNLSNWALLRVAASGSAGTQGGVLKFGDVFFRHGHLGI